MMDLETLHNILNNLHIDINFTLQFSSTEQPFLDVLVKNRDGEIDTDIYYKDTDSKQYLLFYSCYPRHIKINISFNLARRLRTIVPEEQVLQRRMQGLKSFLIKQHYPKQIIAHGLQKAISLDKHVLRMITTKGKENIVPKVSTYNPRDPEMFSVIIENMPILQKDEKMRKILSNYKFIKSKRQPYNLKRLLTKAKFTSNDICEVRKCTKSNRGLFIHLLEGNSFQFNCGMNFKVHDDMTCEVKNILYVMKCRGCGEEYTGEIGNVLRKRVTIHSQQIRDPRTRMLQVSGHFDECASHLNPKYYIFPSYKMYLETVYGVCSYTDGQVYGYTLNINSDIQLPET